MDKRLSDFDKVMSCLLEPLGDYAPKRRYLLLDYNDSSGADLHHEALQYVPRGVTDRDLVRLFWEDLARQGWLLSGIAEYKLDYVTPGLIAWYGSGDNSDTMDGSERLPTLSPGWGATTLGWDGAYGISDGAVLSNTPTGTWGVVARLADISFFENLTHVLGGRPLDYIVVHHMEPDHAKTLEETVRRYPEAKIICNAKIRDMIRNYFTFDIDSRAILVAEGDTYCFGKHTFAYVMAPMVHWPEVMVSFDTTTGTLFSADAFGTFGALNGNLYADEYDFEHDWLPDARRYYTNIVGKYGTQVQALLKKAATLDIRMICPLHGPVWRKNIGWFVDKYSKWSSYTPEQEGSVLIAYSSVYGHTENAAQVLATMLAERGVRNIAMYDVSVTHPSYVVAEAFRCSHLVFASTTYNAGIFCNMETALLDIAAHNLQNRTIALIENGSWAPTAGKLMRGILSKLKNVNILNETLTIKSSLKDDQLAALAEIADALVASMPKPAPIVNEGKQNPAALFKFQYGLFALSAREGDKDNACVINTAIQMANKPERISISVIKANYTCGMIERTGVFNLSLLTKEVPFAFFQHFGFQSGADVDKFADWTDCARSDNGLYYINRYTNAMFSCRVVESYDQGSHRLFIAEITESKLFSNDETVTYDYYRSHIKPAPPKLAPAEKATWVCSVCGYVYEGDFLPEDFICPWCKHPASDFEPLP